MMTRSLGRRTVGAHVGHDPERPTESESSGMSSNDVNVTKPRVLFVYFTYTQQTRKIVDAMTEVLSERGCDVDSAAIEFTDSRYAERFTRFPLKHIYRDLFGMIPAQMRGATGEIGIPDKASDGDYDLVVIGSPTWWLRTSVPIRSYMKSDAAGRILKGTNFAAFVCCRRYWGFNLKTVKKLGVKHGGKFVDGAHWAYAGGQIKSLLSLLSYLGHGKNNEKYLGVNIPVTNLQAPDIEQARTFASGLAQRLADERQTAGAPDRTQRPASDPALASDNEQ
jgi:menaquinone-dependent protoporphyrinogen IX oxidase